MKFVIQRVQQASVEINQKCVASINTGLLVFIGVAENDTVEIADKLVQKLLALRIFEDSKGKTNLSLADVNGALLLVSQFTLYADCKKGNRPSFIKAGNPKLANDLYEHIISVCREKGFGVETGEFGADMNVSLLNDGPFTILLDSAEICS